VGSYIDEEKFALYPQWHIDADIVSAYFKRKKFPDWKGIKSLENKNVGWIREYDFQQYIDVKMNIHEINTREGALGRLYKDRIDVFIDDLIDLQNVLKKEKYLKKFGFNIDDFRFEQLFLLKLYLGFAKNKRGKYLSYLWDKNFQVLLKNGTIKSLFDKYNEQVFPFENVK